MKVIKGIFLLVLVIFIVSCFPENELFLQRDNFLLLPNSFVKIDIPFGRWEIVGWDRKEANILINKYSDPSEDALYAKFKINKYEDVVEIRPEFEGSLRDYVEIKGRVFIPFNSNLKLNIKEGRLTISSIKGNINIKGKGIVKLDDVSGKVSIYLDRGEVLMYVFDDSVNNSYKIGVGRGNIYFYGGAGLRFKIKAASERGRILKGYSFDYGGAEVILKTIDGNIMVDKADLK